MLDKIKGITLGQALVEGGRWLSMLVVVLGVLWQWGEPKAEEFIKETVAEEFKILKEAVDKLEAEARSKGTQLAIQGEQLRSIKELSAEQRALSVEILSALGER